MIKAIIFDWSGVLSDDWECTYLTAQEVLKIRGLKTLTRKQFKVLHEQPWTKFYKNIGTEVDMKEEYEIWGKLMPKNFHCIKLFPYTKKVLAWAKKEGIKSIVLTARSTNSMNVELAKTGLLPLIHKVYSEHENKKKKIHELLKEQNLGTDEVIYVGDTGHDVDTARHAGIKSVAVLSGYDSLEKLEKEKPDYIIDSVKELPALIEKIYGER